MKKTLLLLTLIFLISLSGCSTSKHSEASKGSESSSLSNSSSITSNTFSTESFSVSSTSSIPESTMPSTEESTTNSNNYQEETQEPTSSQAQQVSLPITTVEQAQQRIIDTQSVVSNPDFVLDFYKQIGTDFLFSLRSISIRQQGGSGSAGFYRVNPQGDVFNTDSFGNVY